MPLYEYECESCGKRFEQIQKFSDPPVEKCPACGGIVHKLMSLPAIQFKGSGWYVTDYARKGQTAEGQAEKTNKAETNKKAGESAERDKSSPSSTSTSSSTPPTPSTGSSSSDS